MCSGFPDSQRLLAAALQESEPIELRRRIGIATELAVHETQLIIRWRRCRLQFDGTAQGSDRLLKATLVRVNFAAQIVDVGIGRCAFFGALKGAQRAFIIDGILLQKCPDDRYIDHWVVRRTLRQFPQRRDCSGALPEGDLGLGQPVPRFQFTRGLYDKVVEDADCKEGIPCTDEIACQRNGDRGGIRYCCARLMKNFDRLRQLAAGFVDLGKRQIASRSSSQAGCLFEPVRSKNTNCLNSLVVAG